MIDCVCFSVISRYVLMKPKVHDSYLSFVTMAPPARSIFHMSLYGTIVRLGIDEEVGGGVSNFLVFF